MNKTPTFAFFGTPEPAVEILEELKARNFLPGVIVTNPDKIVGRKKILTHSPVKTWAIANNIPLLQPEKLDEDFVAELKKTAWDVFIVVAYGKIMPKTILDIPTHGSLNVHYSFLPKYRGASPVESQILADDKETGVSILLLDEKMDHGPILASAPVSMPTWPPTSRELRSASNKIAGKLLTDLIPKYISGDIKPTEQDHTQATYTKKFMTEDGLIDLSADPYKNYLKIQAFKDWLPTYFFIQKRGPSSQSFDRASKKMRVIIKDAHYNSTENTLILKKVLPEGKREMSFEDFTKGYL